MPTASPAPTTAADAREGIVEALRLDLVGPHPGHPWETERFPRGRTRPSNVYLTGFLIPSDTDADAPHAGDVDEAEDFIDVGERPGDVSESSAEERRAAKRSLFPSSMGLSFLVPKGTTSLEVSLTWGDYEADEDEKQKLWRRVPRAAALTLELPADGGSAPHPIEGSGGLTVRVLARAVVASPLTAGLPPGTRSVSLFLVNKRTPTADPLLADAAFAFQPALEVRARGGFVPRPDLRGGMDGYDWDHRLADLHHAQDPEFASGHGVSVEWDAINGTCHAVRTAWIPGADVERTVTVDPPGVELGMRALGELSGPDAVRAALSPLVEQHRAWIVGQRAELPAGKRGETADELLHRADLAAGRIERGIETLRENPDALAAFRLANRCVAAALEQRLGASFEGIVKWRAFQLAFFLLNLPGMADPRDRLERETVDLLFFPTGGGKTEAYLGLAAFAMAHRRLTHGGERGGGEGVSVVMRYTLRLLTLDQLGRAAGLVCAMELERRADPDTWGGWPFEIGLWVGKAGTPNRMGFKGEKGRDSARAVLNEMRRDPHTRVRPVPIEACPWCQEPLHAEAFSLDQDNQPSRLLLTCENLECPFSEDGNPLPVVAVDESLYRRLPAFLIATVDKFAALPWTGESGMLLGGATRGDTHGFYGPATPGVGANLPAPLPPPDLVIQDELHLIAGPLGTVMGLYEAAIDALSTRELPDGVKVRPKIVASTATSRAASEQVQALFGRDCTDVFPPPGPDRRDSFFARTPPADAATPARRYLGVSAPGRSAKEVLRRVWLVLMGAAEKQHQLAAKAGAPPEANPADAYMTTLGYFNSLRELGGARRILEEQVQNTLLSIATHKRLDQKLDLFADRKANPAVVELTSRVKTARVAAARARLGRGHHEKDRVDFAIATNMISVGLDVQRLGLMVVMGQPKTHSEYIQATSRVGRDPRKPGLVVCILNTNKPRDRSHFESFRHYHETFYRGVEAASVTPFASRALDRALAGAAVGFARHREPRLCPPQGASRIDEVQEEVLAGLNLLFNERLGHQPALGNEERASVRESLRGRLGQLVETWVERVTEARGHQSTVSYQEFESARANPPFLLHNVLEPDLSPEQSLFRANRSLRDVEPEVGVWVRERHHRSRRP